MATIRSPQLDRTIVELIASGKTLSKVAAELSINKGSISSWMLSDPTFAAELVRARASSQFTRLDECHDIMETEPDVQKARMITDFRKWEASKLVPATYGDRINIDVTNRVDLSNVLLPAEQRLAKLSSRSPANPIDIEPIETKQVSYNSDAGQTPDNSKKPNDNETQKDFDPLGILE